MKYFLRILALLLVVGVIHSCSKDEIEDPDPPQPPEEKDSVLLPGKEMRGVWIATVWELDWPRGERDIEAQKQQYIDYLDQFQRMNINAVFFQVKGMGDAYYDSPYEPWSASISGTRGKDPGYDVLSFLIEEAHARDIEFHAWMNPYRIATRADRGTMYPDLHPSIQSDWVINHEKIQIYNPAIPEVRERLADIVRDLIEKYDVDGIHFDDYFYPDPSSAGQMESDREDYDDYGKDFASIEDFRRNNVNETIRLVHETISNTRPEVVFSVSPAASPDYSMNTLYADVRTWAKEGWLDILIPQLYHEIGNPYNDFQERLAWWAQFSYDATLMIGYGLYRFGDPESPAAFQNVSEMEKQIEMARKNKKVKGHLMYSAQYIPMNRIGITDKLEELFENPGVIPFAGRSEFPDPEPATDLQLSGNTLKWKTTGDVRSVVYYFSDLKREGVVLAITRDQEIPVGAEGYYVVTTLNNQNKESKPSEAVLKK